MTAFRRKRLAENATAPVRFAAADLTDSQVRDMLAAAVSAHLRTDNCYGYIQDVNRAQGFVTFTCWEMGEDGRELYKADFTIDDDYKVTLGKPVEVVETSRYEPVVESSDFSLALENGQARARFAVETFSRREDTAAGVAIYDNALLFRAGDYPDKNFSMSPAEMANAARSWQPVPGNIQHSEFLAGRAGTISRAWIDPTDPTVLRGEVRVPLSLDRLLTDGEKRISMEWNRAGKFADGFALCTNPRVSDAALMSLEANLPPVSGAAKTSGGGRKKSMKLSTCVAAFVNLFRGQEGVEDDLGNIGFGGHPAPAPAPGSDATDARFNTLTTQLATERDARIRSEAAAFAGEALANRRILPAEREDLIAEYTLAAQDDIAHPLKVKFTHDGAEKEGSRVDALRARIVRRPAHRLTDDLWGASTSIGFDGTSASAQSETPADGPVTFSTPAGGNPAKTTFIDPGAACRKATGGKD